MIRGGSFVVVFGPSPAGCVGGAEVVGFAGKGEPSLRRRLTWGERLAKRRRNKARRAAGRQRRR